MQPATKAQATGRKYMYGYRFSRANSLFPYLFTASCALSRCWRLLCGATACAAPAACAVAPRRACMKCRRRQPLRAPVAAAAAATMSGPYVLHIYGNSPQRTEALRDVLSGGSPFTSDTPVALTQSEDEAPATFDAAAYMASLKARVQRAVASQPVALVSQHEWSWWLTNHNAALRRRAWAPRCSRPPRCHRRRR